MTKLALVPSVEKAALETTEFWADRFAEAWERDRLLTARRFLGEYPEVTGDLQVMAHVAFEEYLQRWYGGENVSAESFPDRYPECRDLLATLITILGNAAPVSSHLRPNLATITLDVNLPERPVDWPQVGQTIAGFALIELLGQGTFSRVYVAEERALGDRRVIVKASGGGAGEAHALGKLRHPNIVGIYSVKRWGPENLALICMPFMGRTTLEAVLNRLSRATDRPTGGQQLVAAFRGDEPSLETAAVDRRLSDASYVDAVVWLGVQLADALSYTHRRDICHGDIKPSNILIAADGKPMLLDFNLARERNTGTTRVGGTIPYMSPEVMKNLFFRDGPGPSEVGVRSDLYSLAIVLYELLCGDLPFVGYSELQDADVATAKKLFELQQKGPRPLRPRNPDVGPALAAIIERCLALDLEDRPASADELAASLRALLTWRATARRFASLYRRRLLGIALSIAAVGGMGLYAWSTAPTAGERAFRDAQSARSQGDFATALSRLSDAEVRGFDRHEVADLRAEAFYELANQAFLNNEFSDARDHATQALDAGLRNWRTYLLRARARLHLRELEAARRDLNEASQFRHEPEISATLGDCLCLLEKWDLALAAYQRAMQEGMSSGALANNMAYALSNSGKRRQALDWLNRAIADDSGLAEAHYLRAVLAAALAGEAHEEIPQQARDDIETVIRLRPTNYRVFLSAAGIYALSSEQQARPDFRQRARELLYESLRLGLSGADLPPTGALARLVHQESDSSTYKAAVAQGATALRARPLGLVDSSTGFGL